MTETDSKNLTVAENLLFLDNPHPMWTYDPETLAFVSVNDAAIQRYGYSREEFLSMTIADIRPPEDVPALILSMADRSNAKPPGLFRHILKSGASIDVEITSHSILQDGKYLRLVSARDVSRFIEIERRARTLAEEAAPVFDAPMFVKEWLLRRWAHKVRDRLRGRYSVSSTE